MPECGTYGGYQRHRRRGETACPECKTAKRDDQRKRLASPAARAANVTASRRHYLANPDRQQANRERGLARYYAGRDALRDYWREAGIDPDTCVYCGNAAEHVDHFYPKSRGGSNDFDNLLPACAPCNMAKGAMDPADWLAEVAEHDALRQRGAQGLHSSTAGVDA